MKRKSEETGKSDGSSTKYMYGSGQPYGTWHSQSQGNMYGGNGYSGGGVSGYRGERSGLWYDPWMSKDYRYYNNYDDGSRGYFREGSRDRYDSSRYPYDNSQQSYQRNQWHQYYSDQIDETYRSQIDPKFDHSGGISSTVGRKNSDGVSSSCNGNRRANSSVNDSDSAQSPKPTSGSSSGVVVVEKPYTKSKVKKRPEPRSCSSKTWKREDAERALAAESASMKGVKSQSLIIRFPDPGLSKDIIKNYYPGIEKVHFQVPSDPRYCFVQVSENVNADKVIKELQQIKFGTGTLVVEKKFADDENLSPDGIDPYTLYIGNLPAHVTTANVVERFPTAIRIDLGFAQRLKFSKYAFIQYSSVDAAIEAYKLSQNLVLDSKSVIVRFRRERGPVGLPGESKSKLENSTKQPTKKEASRSKKGKAKEKKNTKERARESVKEKNNIKERVREKEEEKNDIEEIVMEKEKEKNDIVEIVLEKEKEKNDIEEIARQREKEKNDIEERAREMEKMKATIDVEEIPTIKIEVSDDDDDNNGEDDSEEDGSDSDDSDSDDSDNSDEDGNDADDDDSSGDKQEEEDDDDDDNDDEEEDDINFSGHLFQQIDEQIRDLGSIP